MLASAMVKLKGGGIAQWIAFTLPDPPALGLIPGVPDNLFPN